MSTIGGVTPQVDLRGLWTGVRDQGLRSSCLACAATDAHTAAHELEHPLSAECLFYRATMHMPGQRSDAGLTFSAMASALHDDGQCSEQEWPYSSAHPTPWQPPPSISGLWYGVSTLGAGAKHGILAAIDAGQPVVIGVHMTEGFMDVQEPTYRIGEGGDVLGGHAVLGVGKGMTADGEPLVLVRNSWGFQWGFGGYAWMSAGYIDAHLIGYAAIGAKP